jgi:CheY-like chemotaxis protein
MFFPTHFPKYLYLDKLTKIFHQKEFDYYANLINKINVKRILEDFVLFIDSKPSILIIDDDAAILNVFSRIFQKKGYSVTAVERGKEAIEKISSNHYDIALIDLVLPDMEGTELFPLIQNTSPNTLKIMLTGKTLWQTSIKGADALLRKPITPDKLLSLIDSKLKNRNIETQL